MIINKSKYIAYVGLCPASVQGSVMAVKGLVDSKIEASSIIDDDGLDDFDFLLDETKWADPADIPEDISIEMLLKQGKIMESYFKEYMVSYWPHSPHVDLRDIVDIDEAVKRTEEEIAKGTELIFEAAFKVKVGEDFVVTRIDAWHLPTKTMIEFKSTSSSKIKYVFDINYQNLVMEAAGHKPESIYLALIDYVPTPKGKTYIQLTEKCNPSKTAPQLSKKKRDEMDIEEQIAEKKYLKNGFYQYQTIYDWVNSNGGIIVGPTEKMNKRNADKAEKMAELLTYPLERIVDGIKTYAGDYTHMRTSTCCSIFMECPLKKTCRALSGTTMDQFNYSGNVIPLDKAIGFGKNFTPDKVLECCSAKAAIQYTQQMNAFVYGTEWSNKAGIKEIVDKINDNKIVWFDFETVNSPISLFDDTLPYSQMVFQNSYIRTEPGVKEIKAVNQICDPTKFDIDWFKSVVDQLYWEDAYYVVYNASFEKARLNEIALLIKEDSYYKKVDYINEHLIDLADPFTISKGGSCAKACLILPELKGAYSIKKIEKYVTKNQLPMKDTIRPYSELDIKNGGEAMMTGNQKVYGLLSEEEWKEKEIFLKQYCENDVRAMIMTYELLKYKIDLL